MKRSLALAVCGFSLVLALVGGWLADRQFTAALDTLADQAVLQHQRNLFGYADTLQEVKADDSPHMILADDSGTRYINASDKAFAGQLYFDRQRLIVGSVPCTFALLDQTGRVIYSKLPDTIPESELAALKDADTTTMRLCGQTLLLCDQVAGASGQRVWVWMVTALDASSAYAIRTATLRQWFLLQAVLTLAALLMVHHTTALQQLNDRQSRFVADLTHELKTPLMSISGYAELMMNGMVPADHVQEFSGRIYHEAVRLSNLVADIIQLSRLDESNSEVPFEEVDLYELAEDVQNNLRHPAEKKNISLELTGNSEKIQGVRHVLYEMFFNIADNAVRYTEQNGHVRIMVGNRKGNPFYCVVDDGIGIPKSEQGRIFERFYRVDKSHSRQTGGTGLGLSIVKHGATLHHAQIHVESEQGEGTRMEIVFPGKDQARG